MAAPWGRLFYLMKIYNSLDIFRIFALVEKVVPS